MGQHDGLSQRDVNDITRYLAGAGLPATAGMLVDTGLQAQTYEPQFGSRDAARASTERLGRMVQPVIERDLRKQSPGRDRMDRIFGALPHPERTTIRRAFGAIDPELLVLLVPARNFVRDDRGQLEVKLSDMAVPFTPEQAALAPWTHAVLEPVLSRMERAALEPVLGPRRAELLAAGATPYDLAASLLALADHELAVLGLYPEHPDVVAGARARLEWAAGSTGGESGRTTLRAARNQASAALRAAEAVFVAARRAVDGQAPRERQADAEAWAAAE